MLASAGDDGNVVLWIPSDSSMTALGEENSEDKETWRVKHSCRSSTGAEIYDLAWSPDGVFFITGGVDNTARIFNAHTGMHSADLIGLQREAELYRSIDPPNCRAQSLCAGSGVGSSQRICRNTILRPLCPYLHIEAERRDLYPYHTR